MILLTIKYKRAFVGICVEGSNRERGASYKNRTNLSKSLFIKHRFLVNDVSTYLVRISFPRFNYRPLVHDTYLHVKIINESAVGEFNND